MANRTLVMAMTALAASVGMGSVPAQAQRYFSRAHLAPPSAAASAAPTPTVTCGSWNMNSGLYSTSSTKSRLLGATTDAAAAMELCRKSGEKGAGMCIHNGESAYWATGTGASYVYGFKTEMKWASCNGA